MRKTIFLITFVAVVMFTGFLYSKQGDIYNRITVEQLLSIMQSEGFDVRISHGMILWQIVEANTFIIVNDDRKSMTFYTSFGDSNVNMIRVNEWNRTVKYGCAYLDADGDPCLRVDLDLTGGVTEARIIDFLSTCGLLFVSWLQDVVM